MKQRTIVSLLVALGLVLTACATPTAAPQPTSAPAQPTSAPVAQPTAVPPTKAPVAAEPIKIAIIGAFSGTNAVLGDWMKKGVTLAVEEKNAAGGIKGRKIEIIIYDDEADPTKSVNLAKKVATEDKVMAAWATTNSSSALADIPFFQQYKIPQLTNGTNVDITRKGSAFVFRATPAGPSFEDTLVDFLVKKGSKKFAIISDTSAYGKGEGDYQEAALQRNNLKALTRESFGIDDKDFTGQLTKILQTQPEVLLLASSEVASGLIAKQARQLGFKGQIAGGAAVGTPKFIETAGADVAEGVIFTTPWLHDESNPASVKFVNAYKARWNNEVAEFHGANTYDGTQLLLLAMEKADPLTPENVAAEMHKIKGYKGLQGTFNVTESGETITGTLVCIVKAGKLTVYADK
jgi:branched-chain amino acid transport system substrate-binding protein